MGLLASRLGIIIGVLTGIVASQAPEFGQQYRQRLGGALDEANRDITVFTGEARQAGLTPPQAIERLKDNSDILARTRGEAMTETITRRDRMEKQERDFENAGSFARLYVLVSEGDPQVAARTYDAFEPAVPMTGEGWVCAGAGFVAGYSVWSLLMLPFSRRRRRRAAGAAAKSSTA